MSEVLEPKILDRLKTSTVEICLLENNICWLKYHKDTDVTLDVVKENIAANIQLAKGKPFRTLIDAQMTMGNMSAEAMEYIKNNEANRKLKIAEAIVVRHLGIRIILSFYARLKNHPCPVKVFSKLESAINWLNSVPNRT